MSDTPERQGQTQAQPPAMGATATTTNELEVLPPNLSPVEIERGQVPVLSEAPPERQAQIKQIMAQINIHDSNAVMFFGSKAQEQVTSISDSMQEGVRNKDTGPAGAALNDMLASLRGFDVKDIDPNEKPGFIARLFGAIKPAQKLIQRYEQVKGQIDSVTDRLEGHTTQLMTDVTTLDKLYDANLDYFHTLADYIAAGDAKLAELDRTTIPAKEQEAASGDVLKSQELRDLRQARDDLERRVHDLKLTRQVAMQSLPAIRIVQENDKSLISKIQSTIRNTVPLWRQQLAMAVTIARSADAGQTLKESTDLTNELLTANADMLRQSNQEIRTQIERGVFDIGAIEKANRQLIGTIEDSLKIADDAKAKRVEAEQKLVKAESDLKHALQAAKSRTTALPPAAS